MIVDRRFRGAYCLHHQGWVILHIFRNQNAHKTETCDVCQEEIYFSTNAQPPSALPVTRVTHKVTSHPKLQAAVVIGRVHHLAETLPRCAKFVAGKKLGTPPLISTLKLLFKSWHKIYFEIATFMLKWSYLTQSPGCEETYSGVTGT
jgi:hypothetical protein